MRGIKMDMVERYKRVTYNILGRHLDDIPIHDVTTMLYQADVEMTSGMFLAMALVTALLASIPVLIFSIIALPGSIFIPALTAFTFLLVFIMFPFVLYNKISNKKISIEKELPFALAYMSILSSAGSTPLDIIRRMATENYGDISREFRKVMYRVDVLGEDEVSAMNDLSKYTPSEIFRTIIIDIANIMYSGSGMKNYLESKSKDLLDIKRQTQREFVDSLTVYGEGYMGGILMVVILTVLGIVMAGALNIDLGPFKPDELFNYFVYLIMPFVNIIFYLLLEMKYSRSP
jgi:flagellar protein FlaJ